MPVSLAWGKYEAVWLRLLLFWSLLYDTCHLVQNPRKNLAIPGHFPCSISVLNKATPTAIGARHWNLFCLTMSGMEFGVIPTGVCHKNQSHQSTCGVSESMNVREKFLLSCTRNSASTEAVSGFVVGRDLACALVPPWSTWFSLQKGFRVYNHAGMILLWEKHWSILMRCSGLLLEQPHGYDFICCLTLLV